MKIKNLFVLTVAITLVSCSKNEAIDNNEPQEIRLNSAVTTQSLTRAPFEGALSATNALTAAVLGTEIKSDYATLHVNGTMTFTGGTEGVPFNKPVITGTTTFPTGGKVYLSGLYPSTGWTTTTGVSALTLSGKEDLMYAPEVEATKSGVAALSFETLEFEHQLTKMDICFRATENNIYTVTGIKLVKVDDADIKPNAKIALATGELTYETTTTPSFNCYRMEVDANNVVTYSDNVFNTAYNVTTDYAYKAYVLAPAVQATAPKLNEYAFEISYTKDGAATTVTKAIDLRDILANGAVTANAFAGSTKGYAFSILFHFNNTEINVLATVKDWNVGGETIVEME